jgi:hypothetical protein
MAIAWRTWRRGKSNCPCHLDRPLEKFGGNPLICGRKVLYFYLRVSPGPSDHGHPQDGALKAL